MQLVPAADARFKSCPNTQRRQHTWRENAHIYTLCLSPSVSVFQKHSEDLEITPLLDENNLTRSQCFLLWGEGTFHVSFITPIQSSTQCTDFFLLFFPPDLEPFYRAVQENMKSHVFVFLVVFFFFTSTFLDLYIF